MRRHNSDSLQQLLNTTFRQLELNDKPDQADYNEWTNTSDYTIPKYWELYR